MLRDCQFLAGTFVCIYQSCHFAASSLDEGGDHAEYESDRIRYLSVISKRRRWLSIDLQMSISSRPRLDLCLSDEQSTIAALSPLGLGLRHWLNFDILCWKHKLILYMCIYLNVNKQQGVGKQANLHGVSSFWPLSIFSAAYRSSADRRNTNIPIDIVGENTLEYRVSPKGKFMVAEILRA